MFFSDVAALLRSHFMLFQNLVIVADSINN